MTGVANLFFSGTSSMKNVLQKFSVSNRNNMYVYKESHTSHVFYLRLVEGASARGAGAEEINLSKCRVFVRMCRACVCFTCGPLILFLCS